MGVVTRRAPAEGACGAGAVLRAFREAPTGERAELVERAYAVAAYWHRDQRRRSGDPYITHPVAVAVILAEAGMDHEVVCAALLHDVLEDTGCSEAELAGEFGAGVTGLLAVLRRLEDPAGPPDGWPTSTDTRVLMLKLADRLHNLRTLRFLSPAKQRLKSRQSLEVFVPVARRLGVAEIEREIEELATATIAAQTAQTALTGHGEAVPRSRPSADDQSGMRMAFGAISLGAALLPASARARWLAEWRGELHALPGGRARARFTAQLLAGMPRMALALRRTTPVPVRRLLERGARVVRWAIASDVRAWTLLAPPVGWVVVKTAATGLGDALAMLLSLPPVLQAGVRTLRSRLGVPHPRPSKDRC
ncbi:HD domain-containing protein [Sphaerisporangium sp. NPDC005289]|uniref:HD domain-containing protein n=1 Tax=Sphaerisporangium sp. NPDC005289 TaxID=3155247 RepID=UPI0033A3E075